MHFSNKILFAPYELSPVYTKSFSVKRLENRETLGKMIEKKGSIQTKWMPQNAWLYKTNLKLNRLHYTPFHQEILF